MPGNSLIGNLAVTLGLNTAAFERGATKAEARANTLRGRMAKIGDSIKGFAGGLAAGIGVAAIGALAKNAFDMASALDESSQKIGLTVEALQELNLAATQSGISEESLAGGIRKMNKAIGELAQGSKPAVEAFAKIGLSFDDLKGKSPDQQLRIIADALNKLPDVQQRVAIGSQIMGKNFSELLPLINGGSAALDKYAEISRKNGQITTEEAKRLDELADSWDRTKIRAGVFTAKVIAMFAELADKLDASLFAWYKWRDGVIQAAGQLASEAVAALGRLVEGVRNAIVNGLGRVMDWAKGKIQEVGDKFKWLYNVTVGHSYVPDMVQGIADSMSQLQKIMVDPALSATQKVGAAFQALAGTIGNLFGQKAGSIIGAIGQFATALAPLFGRSSFNVASFNSTVASNNAALGTNLPGFASGGSGVFGGFGGIDRNILKLNDSPIARVSKGEHWSVSPNANNNRPIHFDLRGAVMTHDLLKQMNQIGAVATGQGAVLGAGGGVAAMQHKAARMLP